MGVVYIVHDHHWGIRLAAKRFQDEILAIAPDVAQRFKQEAELWIGLDSHPNIVQAILVKNVQGAPLIFLEYVERDLASYISAKELAGDLDTVLQFAINFCDGIGYAYSKGLKAHRDVKPANCLVSANRILKITDFGLASIRDVVESEIRAENKDTKVVAARLSMGLTPANAGLGTPAYMAPEQFFDARHVDLRADVYAFGIMLYEMATDHLPFVGRSNLEWAQFHCGVSVPHLPAAIPPTLDAIIQRCVSKNQSDRYDDFGKIRGELAHLFEEVSGRAAPQPQPVADLDSAQWRRKGIGLADLGHFTEALNCFDESLECDPADGATWHCKGVVLGRMGKRDEGLACTERAIKLDPNSSLAWGNRAMDLLELGRAEEALTSANTALALNPNDWNSCVIRAVVLNHLKRYEEAIETAKRSVQIYPGADIGWAQQGIALRALDRNAEALACFDESLRLNENNTTTLREKAEILIDTGRCDEALPYLDRALLLEADNWALWWDKGIVAGSLKDVTAELKCFGRCVELEPKMHPAWYRKGVALHDLGRINEALECYDRALALEPSQRDALKAKAYALRDTDRAKEALEYHDRLIELDPDDPTAWNDKGATFCAAADVEKALGCFERALQLDPNHDMARRNRAALKRQ